MVISQHRLATIKINSSQRRQMMLQTLRGFERIWLNSDIDQSRQWLKRNLTPAQRSITELRF
ncbi:hypothetical protein SynMITS9220_02704 [Synechococcus sp. MIT S9220]|nr:hypothetical protein SynMITS9220_02704 [Synechococcus sp. MIT S9220]